MREEKWQEALLVCRRIADEQHKSPQRLREVLRHVKPDAEQLRAEDTGSSWWLLGEMQEAEEAFESYLRAAAKGHALAAYVAGNMLCGGKGIERDTDRATELLLQAAELGHRVALNWAAITYAHDPRKVAQFYLLLGQSNDDRLQLLMSRDPLAAAPLGEWEPRWHALVPREMHDAMHTTMLLCKRRKVPHDVAKIIVSFVCTE